MKKILLLTLAVILLAACGPHLYNTHSSGKDNSSYIIVLTNGQSYNSVSVIVDGKINQIEKVYKVKDTRKAHPVIISPGRHQIKVVSNERTLIDEYIFVGLQETKKIILE